MDAGDRAVLGGRALERGLDLARHQLRRGVAHEVADVGADVGRRVEDLALEDPGPRVAGDVADRVAAALAGGQVGVRQLADELGGVAQRDVVDLDVLPRRDVALVQRRVLLDHRGERVHLVGRDPTERQLDADHLDVGLALPIDALLQAEADVLVLGRLPVEELLRLVVEVVELPGDRGDDVTGDVLVDLGVRDGPLAANGGGLHGAQGTKSRLQIHLLGLPTRQADFRTVRAETPRGAASLATRGIAAPWRSGRWCPRPRPRRCTRLVYRRSSILSREDRFAVSAGVPGSEVGDRPSRSSWRLRARRTARRGPAAVEVQTDSAASAASHRPSSSPRRSPPSHRRVPSLSERQRRDDRVAPFRRAAARLASTCVTPRRHSSSKAARRAAKSASASALTTYSP